MKGSSSAIRPSGFFGMFAGAGNVMGRSAVAGGVVGALAGSDLIFGDDGKHLIGKDEAPTYGFQQALFEGALGDPWADVTMTGGHINLWDHMILPNLIPGPDSLERFNARGRAFDHLNGQSVANWQADQKAERWRFNNEGGDRNFDFYNAGDKLLGDVMTARERGGYDFPIMNDSTIGYRPRQQSQAHDPNFGRLVFGMHNMRMGG
jgi:hypothetical protein